MCMFLAQIFAVTFEIDPCDYDHVLRLETSHKHSHSHLDTIEKVLKLFLEYPTSMYKRTQMSDVRLRQTPAGNTPTHKYFQNHNNLQQQGNQEQQKFFEKQYQLYFNYSKIKIQARTEVYTYTKAHIYTLSLQPYFDPPLHLSYHYCSNHNAITNIQTHHKKPVRHVVLASSELLSSESCRGPMW